MLAGLVVAATLSSGCFAMLGGVLGAVTSNGDPGGGFADGFSVGLQIDSVVASSAIESGTRSRRARPMTERQTAHRDGSSTLGAPAPVTSLPASNRYVCGDAASNEGIRYWAESLVDARSQCIAEHSISGADPEDLDRFCFCRTEWERAPPEPSERPYFCIDVSGSLVFTARAVRSREAQLRCGEHLGIGASDLRLYSSCHCRATPPAGRWSGELAPP